MGQVKQYCEDALEQKADAVMDAYGRFLQKAVKDPSIPHSYDDAIKHVATALGLYVFQVRFVIEQRTESLYEGD
jgi:hypothetical protein